MGNDTGRFVLGLLLGVSCGGGLAYWLASGSGSRTAGLVANLERGVEAASGGSEARAADRLAAPRAGTDREEYRPSTAPAPVSDAQVQSMLASAGPVSAPSADGDASLWGTVVDEAGAPLAGVLVRLQHRDSSRPERSPSDVGAAAPREHSAEDAVREALERHASTRALRRDLSTDETGAFRVDGVAEGEWSISAYREGYEFDVQDSRYGLVSTGTAIRIVASPVVEVPVTVVGADGRKPEVAFIQTTPVGERRGPSFTWKPSEAFVRLSPGRHEVTAESNDGGIGRAASAKSETAEVLLQAGAVPDALVLELRARSGIRGRVLGAGDGVETGRVMVSAAPLAAGQVVDESTFGRTNLRDNVSVGTEFQFLDLEPGRYAVGVTRGYNTPVIAHREVDVAEGLAQLDMQLPAIDPERTLRVMVYDPDGQPAAGVDLNLQGPGGDGFGVFGAAELRTEDGAYLVEPSEEQGELYFGTQPIDREFSLRANHETYGQLDVLLTRGQLEVTMRYTSPATLTVSVAGYVGSGLEGRLSVRVAKSGGGNRMYFSSRSNRSGLNAEGVEVFEGQSPGEYSVSLVLAPESEAGARSRSQTIERQTVELVSGPNSVQLAIPALHALRVHWADGKPGLRMTLSSVDETGMEMSRLYAELDANGFADFENVRTGDYLLVATRGSTPLQMRVRVPSKDVEFTPMTVDALRVETLDEEGDLAGVGLRHGDLIIGRDGAPFTEAPGSGLLGELTTTKSAQLRLLVERGGERIDVLIRAADVGDWRKLGGRLVPTQR